MCTVYRSVAETFAPKVPPSLRSLPVAHTFSFACLERVLTVQDTELVILPEAILFFCGCNSVFFLPQHDKS